MYLLGYDIGSSSVKASLVNAESGKCVSSAFFPKTEAEIIAVKPGWAEQNPENWWENLKLANASRIGGCACGCGRHQSHRYLLPDARIGVRGQRTKGIASCNHLVRFQSRSLRTKMHLKRWERSYASRICSTLRVTSPRPNLPG